MWAGNLLMDTWMPEVMLKVAEERWRNALASGADTLVTASPSEYAILKKAKPEDMEFGRTTAVDDKVKGKKECSSD